MRMGSMAGWSLAIATAIVCVPVAASAKPPRLASKHINADKCPNDGNPGSHRCASVTGYTVVSTKNEMSDFRFVLHESDGFQVFLEPDACQEVRHDANIELRTFNGEPFAAIQRVQCFEPVTMIQKNAPKRKPIAAFIVLRGLQGFEKLHKDLKMKGAGGAKKARQLADTFFKRAWPKIEQARAQAEGDGEEAGDE